MKITPAKSQEKYEWFMIMEFSGELPQVSGYGGTEKFSPAGEYFKSEITNKTIRISNNSTVNLSFFNGEPTMAAVDAEHQIQLKGPKTFKLRELSEMVHKFEDSFQTKIKSKKQVVLYSPYIFKMEYSPIELIACSFQGRSVFDDSLGVKQINLDDRLLNFSEPPFDGEKIVIGKFTLVGENIILYSMDLLYQKE
ncbi:MAG: hypothetical protein AAFX87_19165 [Bacteroidota bacterium]